MLTVLALLYAILLGGSAFAADITVSPPVFSPNGDSVNDTATIIARVPQDAELTVEVLDSFGSVVAVPALHLKPDRGRVDLTWDGLRGGKSLPDGTYRVQAVFKGKQDSELTTEVKINNVHKWPPISYKARPLFPIGVWFEGAPGAADYPDDAKGARKYYDRCFADLKAHGFNCAAVPNCPEHLWDAILQSAQKHGFKIVLEIGPLVSLVSSPEPLTEGEVYEVVQRVVDRIGKYDSLLRYQIRDEPPPQLVPNWLLVQRILAAVDPRRPAFSCFCGPDSLANVAGQAPLSEAVFDIYPHHPGTPPRSLGSFLPALDAFTSAAKDNTKWAVLQSFAKPDAWRYPSAEELRAVTYLSLAAGAKGVFYFIYQTMPKHPEKLEGLVYPDGKPTAMYGPAAELAKELGRLSPLLLSLKPAEPVEVEGDARVGSFTDAKGRRVLIVASTRPDAAVTAKLKVSGSWKDALSGERFVAGDGALVVVLRAGSGRILVGRALKTGSSTS